jgi:ATP-dependent DNA helicase RecQ
LRLTNHWKERLSLEALREIVREVWGYDEFRPLQAEAIDAVINHRDSVVVLPTGGGKSLCFQAPALSMPGTAVVVSPLIALMHDQVDALVEAGVAAAYVNSTLTPDERRRAAEDVRSGRTKLLYLSPERLTTDRTLDFLQTVQPSFFAIDEAHCISEWGHDFRPEYRMLGMLKERFPDTAVHAYTATATARVRQDIVRELHLHDPVIHVGSFDRPNLVYRAERRAGKFEQVRAVVERHPDESGVIYCMRRADVEETCAALVELGHSALPYHAGLPDDVRRRNQDAFIKDRCKIMVATVAFGMGIDKSNVRYVIHAAAPKSLEAYQQESGRAGRDGLEAECCLFYSGADFQTWRKFQEELPPEAAGAASALLDGMERYATGLTCRHRSLVEYFGQTLPGDNCQACDVCLEEVELADDSLKTAQKIISCVARLRESYGGDYTAQVLVGSREQRILEKGHDKLSTFGLLDAHDKRQVRDWIEQLVGQGFLVKGGEYGVLQITAEGRELLGGGIEPRLAKPTARSGRGERTTRKKTAKAAEQSWEGVDRGLFDALRTWRRTKADERGLPPFIIFGDAVLRDLARFRPSTADGLLHIRGMGQKKGREYGEELLELIVRYCREEGKSTDVEA